MSDVFPVIGVKCHNCKEYRLMSDRIDTVYCAECGNDEFSEDGFEPTAQGDSND